MVGLGAFVRRVVHVLRLLCPQRQCLGDKEHCSGVADAVAASVPADEQAAVQALIIEELKRLHEGVLARYGLRPSEFAAWKAFQSH